MAKLYESDNDGAKTKEDGANAKGAARRADDQPHDAEDDAGALIPTTIAGTASMSSG